jgi:3-oxoacyl-[acyl-carrier protein] reductase
MSRRKVKERLEKATARIIMEKPSRKLAGKCALVTGASAGIGRGIALRFGKEGANVAVNYNSSEKEALEVVGEIKQNHVGAITIRADVSKRQEVDSMVSRAVQEFGKLDILVNNAGVFLDVGKIEETPDDVWTKTLDINLTSAFLVTRRCIPELLKQNRGKIINMASIDSFLGEPNAVSYCVSKAGLIGLTHALAAELAPKKINVNAIAPGMILTRMAGNIMEDKVKLKNLEDKTPFGRIGYPDDVASAATFLASDESEFINGAVIVVDGGWSIDWTR